MVSFFTGLFLSRKLFHQIGGGFFRGLPVARFLGDGFDDDGEVELVAFFEGLTVVVAEIVFVVAVEVPDHAGALVAGDHAGRVTERTELLLRVELRDPGCVFVDGHLL